MKRTQVEVVRARHSRKDGQRRFIRSWLSSVQFQLHPDKLLRSVLWLAICLVALAFGQGSRLAGNELGEHGYADSSGVRIHYVTAGEGPLLVMIHGFPDYWYTWREQMPALAQHYQVVAIDQRGYNKSDKPAGVENYTVDKLTGDVLAVIKHFQRETAIIVGHDWGGMVAWRLAMSHPDVVDRLIILNLPHPNGILRELANNPQQRMNSAYARFFQTSDAASQLTPEGLASWVKDKAAREKYVAALRESSLEAMLNYYKANYPREPYEEPKDVLPKVKCSVLMIHGLKDKALLAAGLNNTWEWVEKDLTILTLPDADHFVQQDEAQAVTQAMLRWLGKDD